MDENHEGLLALVPFGAGGSPLWAFIDFGWRRDEWDRLYGQLEPLILKINRCDSEHLSIIFQHAARIKVQVGFRRCPAKSASFMIYLRRLSYADVFVPPSEQQARRDSGRFYGGPSAQRGKWRDPEPPWPGADVHQPPVVVSSGLHITLTKASPLAAVCYIYNLVAIRQRSPCTNLYNTKDQN
ncbi:hypothetical protein C8R47DRAFT_1251752 [Mycena vitilis]|nr:hypothetical protein C8R47DRAFT_1251752 [Mycena vitilis]